MWQNSTELLEYALRELQVAVKDNRQEVRIVLREGFDGDLDEIREICDRLEIKVITDRLRKEFTDYNIKSVVGKEGHLKMILSFENGPCDIYYPLVWTLTLRKKFLK